MQPITIGVWDEPLGRYVSLTTLDDAHLHFSGARAVLEVRDAWELRKLLTALTRPFIVERGRVGLEGCRVDTRRRSGTVRRVKGNSTMPPTPLPLNVLSFAYDRTYDTAQSESLPPPSMAGGWRAVP